MNKMKVAIITLGDTRRAFFETRAHIALEETNRIKDALSEAYELFAPEPVFSVSEGLAVADQVRARGIGCVVIHLPIWGTPNLAFRIAASTALPVLLLGNRRTDSSSLVALLAVAGILGQTGKPCIRLAGDIRDKAVRKQFEDFALACHLVEQIKRHSFCMIGGRSIGIGTTVADPSQWQRVFGVEFDHCDQYEIVYRANDISPERVALHRNWVAAHIPTISFDGIFNEQTLQLQIRSYLALKDMAEEKGYTFLGLKCQQEMSDHFVLQCLGVALLNNHVDADGLKAPIPTACESDCDGALTMLLLSICSGGRPSNLVDIRCFNGETKEILLANCGSMAPYFADPADWEKAMKKTALLPHVFGKAGGAAVQMIAKEGPVTIARLFRRNGEYVLGCFEGTLEMRPLDELKKTTWCYPHEFVRADIDYDRFFQTINSNHLHTAYGSYCSALKLFCEMTGIAYIRYD